LAWRCSFLGVNNYYAIRFTYLARQFWRQLLTDPNSYWTILQRFIELFGGCYADSVVSA
jgi:hypothetical protein